jgi:hypothetical protein
MNYKEILQEFLLLPYDTQYDFFIGQGASRIVYKYKGIAIKQQVGRNLQNEREVLLWNHLVETGNTMRQYFAEIYYYTDDYKWICMEYCQVEEDLNTSDGYGNPLWLGEQSYFPDTIFDIVDDLWTNNIGKRGNQYVVIDYGMLPCFSTIASDI